MERTARMVSLPIPSVLSHPVLYNCPQQFCRAGASLMAVQIGDPIECSMRLRRPDLRKASGFPANVTTTVLLRAGWKAQPSSLLGGGSSGRTPYGKAEPSRTTGGRAAGRHPPEFGQDRGKPRPYKRWSDTIAGRTCALNLAGLKCILSACLHGLSVKVSARTVADPSCPRTCLTRPLYNSAESQAAFTTNAASWAIECQPHQAGERL